MLPRHHRLTTKDFKDQKKGEYLNTPLFRVKIIKDTTSKLGIIVSKKTIKKASDRNLLIRRVRHLYTHSGLCSRPNTYIIGYIAKQKDNPNYSDLVHDLQPIIKK